MRNLCILLLIFIWSICPGQNENFKENLQLNHLLDPVETEVVLDFGIGLKAEIRFRMDYYQILGYPFRLDTTVAQGTKMLSIKIPVDHPVNMRIRTDDQMDHLFLIPGQKTSAVYNPDVDNQNRIIASSPESALHIDQYYHDLLDLLGISSQRISAYRAFQGLMDIKEKFAAYDSLAFIQHQLLAEHTDRLPEWFVNYEWKSIKYMTKLFTVSAISYQNYYEKKQMVDYLPLTLLDTDVNDTMGLLTSHYIWYLKDYALLTMCAEDCYQDGESALHTRFRNILRFSKEITNPLIRQAFLTQTLRSLYSTSQPFPDSLIEAYEEQLTPPYLDFLRRFKKSSIAGADAPHFYLSNPEGEAYTLKDLEGQVVLLNFWFVGCKPCEKELPHEKELVAQLQNEDFQLVNICANTSEDAWKEFVSENNMPGLNLYAKGNWGSKLADSYQFSAFPTYVLIDKEGKIVLDKAPRPSGEQLMDEIRKKLD